MVSRLSSGPHFSHSKCAMAAFCSAENIAEFRLQQFPSDALINFQLTDVNSYEENKKIKVYTQKLLMSWRKCKICLQLVAGVARRNENYFRLF